MGFFDSLIGKRVPMLVKDLDYKVSCRQRTGFAYEDFERIIEQIGKTSAQLDDSNQRAVADALKKLYRNPLLSHEERGLVAEKIKIFARY